MPHVRPTVLVVDDDNETRAEYATWLSDAGYRCVTAADTPTALWLAHRFSPDAVVIDVGRSRERLKLAACLADQHSTTAVIVTSTGRRSPLPSMPTGVCRHLRKPTQPGELVSAVKDAASMKHAADVSAREHRRGLETIITQRQQRLGDLMATATSADDAHDALRATFGDQPPALLTHARRVAQTAAMMAETLYLAESDARIVHGAALLHDIGKLTLPEPILFGHTTVGEVELQALGNHHERTLALLARAPRLRAIARVVEFVHARWDGTGMPWGLAGEDIPLSARVVAVADALDGAVNGTRGSIDPDARFGVLTRGAGTRLDPDLVRVFLHTLDRPRFPSTGDSDQGLGATCS
jgi:putative nucleotidyltransferase with HDIG domain